MSSPEPFDPRPSTTSYVSEISDIFNQGSSYRQSYGTSPSVHTQATEPYNKLMRGNRIGSTSSESDIVKVEITDLECNASTSVTIGALRRCKRDIVSPFYNCLKFVGWRQFGYGRVSFGSKTWSVFNWIYFLFILSLLLFHYAFQVAACNSRSATEVDDSRTQSHHHHHTTRHPNSTRAPSREWISLIPSVTKAPTPNPVDAEDKKSTCHHLYTSYVIPNLMHLLAFLLGFVHFRWRSNEDMDGLMEKVFLYCESTFTRQVSQRVIIQRMKSFLHGLVVWVIASIGTHALCDICTWDDKVPFENLSDIPSIITLFAIDMVGTVIASGVSMTIILNYIVNCELINFYARSVMNKLRERSLNLRVAIKDLYQINIATKRLNETTSLITSLVVLISLEKIVIGLIICININHTTRPIIWVYRILFIAIRVPVFLLPLVQAARVNAYWGRFRRTILEIRTFGYQNAPQIELDSIVLFCKANKFRAKLFFVPVRATYLVIITVTTAFLILLLIQNGLINNVSYI